MNSEAAKKRKCLPHIGVTIALISAAPLGSGCGTWIWGVGTDGISCWDLNGNRVNDPEEDINGDGVFDALDCQGPPGLNGLDGPIGPAVPIASSSGDEPKPFDIFIDDFFAAESTGIGDLPVGSASISEPVLGAGSSMAQPFVETVAFRFPIPDSFTSQNDVTMRIFFYRTGASRGACSAFTFAVDARRLRTGIGIEIYDHTAPAPSVPGRRWVRIDPDDTSGNAANGNGTDSSDALVVLDLPLNTLAGLDYPNDLEGGDVVAIELSTHHTDGRAVFQLLGVEFIESGPGVAALRGAIVFATEPGGALPDPSVDCNQNGFPDSLDIERGTSSDCDCNGIPDECASCPSVVDLVFLMDTSNSIKDEAETLCSTIGDVVDALARRSIEVDHEILAISPNVTDDIPPCISGLTNSVSTMFGTSVPGNNGACPADLDAPGDSGAFGKNENWGPATALVAQEFQWTPGAIRVIVPISDEGACLGTVCKDPGRDRDSIQNAIVIANQNNVIVSPITAYGSNRCVITLARDLAAGTGGTSFGSTDPAEDLAGAVNNLIDHACRSASDCNGNGTPDVCEICQGSGAAAGEAACFEDCNRNGTIDVCEIREETPNGAFFCTVNCDPDVNGNGIPDSCE